MREDHPRVPESLGQHEFTGRKLVHLRVKTRERRIRFGSFAHGDPGRNDIVVVDDLSVLMPDGARKLPEPDFRTLQIQQNARVNAVRARGFANRRDSCRVLILFPVRRVQAENIDTRGEKLAENTRGIGGRPQGGYNFGIWHPSDYLARRGGAFAGLTSSSLS